MYHCRVQSRVCVIPFEKPSIAPSTEERQDAFEDLEDMLADGLPSSAFGWAVAQKALLQDKEAIRDLKSRFRSHFQGRAVQNWSLLALCLKQVSNVKLGTAQVHYTNTHPPMHTHMYPPTHIRTHPHMYTLSLLCVQLLLEAGFPELVEPAINFIFQAYHGVSADQSAADVDNSDDDIDAAVILQTVEDIIESSAVQPLSKVSHKSTDTSS